MITCLYNTHTNGQVAERIPLGDISSSGQFRVCFSRPPPFCRDLLPISTPTSQRALREFVLTVDDTYGKQFEELSVGFEGR